VNYNKPWEQGWISGLIGEDPRLCPYDKMTKEWYEWQSFHGKGIEFMDNASIQWYVEKNLDDHDRQAHQQPLNFWDFCICVACLFFVLFFLFHVSINSPPALSVSILLTGVWMLRSLLDSRIARHYRQLYAKLLANEISRNVGDNHVLSCSHSVSDSQPNDV
jgi:hypothetical protein